MTKSTDTKNITAIVKGILKRNGIDNLKAEIDLISAWMRYLFEREEGSTPAETRAKIAEALGFFGDTHTDRARMLQLIMDTLGVEVDESQPEWKTVISFCLDAEKKNQTISDYRAWMNSDPFNSPKKHQIANSPLIIKKTWASAFEKHKTDETKGGYHIQDIGEREL
jgi:hypothetical protein